MSTHLEDILHRAGVHAPAADVARLNNLSVSSTGSPHTAAATATPPDMPSPSLSSAQVPDSPPLWSRRQTEQFESGSFTARSHDPAECEPSISLDVPSSVNRNNNLVSVSPETEPRMSTSAAMIDIPSSAVQSRPPLGPAADAARRSSTYVAPGVPSAGAMIPDVFTRRTNPWELPPVSPRVLTQGSIRGSNCGCPVGTEIDLVACLQQSPHFCLFPFDVLNSFDILRRDYMPGEEILPPGSEPTHVYVVVGGVVDVYRQETGSAHVRVGGVETYGVFGAGHVILKRSSMASYRAGERSQTTLALISRKEFVRAIRSNQRVQQSLARNMTEQMALFSVFRMFCREVFSSSETNLNLANIIQHYGNLSSCLHPNLASKQIDVDAWAYAIHRLPQNITKTFSLNLSRSLPPFLAERMRNELAHGEDDRAQPHRIRDSEVLLVKTRYRRRAAWQLGFNGGKTLVLLRDGFTDMLDFVTMLCAHMTESRKLRGRLQGMVSPAIADLLDGTLNDPVHQDYIVANHREDPERQLSILEKLPLSKKERSGLHEIWPTDLLSHLRDIIMHREEYVVRVMDGITKRFDAEPFHQWMLNIRNTVMRALNLAANDSLPVDLTVHIISSNTYSTKHVLLPFVRDHHDRILKYGREHRKDLVDLPWRYEEDMLYSMLDNYIRHNRLQHEYNTCLAKHGFYVLEDRAATGLAVDIICLRDIDVDRVDTVMHKLRSRTRTELKNEIILNMDYAFGAQADGILRALSLLFGHRIKSVNVLGKAGGLVGKRGDIQLATHVLLSKSSLANSDATDELRSCDNRDVKKARLEELSGRDVHVGPVLTIPGTVLQNIQLLRYYSFLWGCVGVEMEGSYFARQVVEGMEIGLLRSDVRQRYAYNTSDLPLQASGDSNLSTDLRPDELVPPLYAITRSFVEQILFGVD
eukprot:PhM_4_TR18702/c0_g1_i1/m.7904